MTNGTDSELMSSIGALSSGSVVALPTDTVYGLAAKATSEVGMDALFALKGRSDTQPIAVLVGSLAMAQEIAEFCPLATSLATRFWPGPLTLVLKRKSNFRANLGGDPANVGVRFPDSGLIASICSEIGPIAASSANLSGTETKVSASQVREEFGDQLGAIIDGGDLTGSASTVVSLADGGLKLLREGEISEPELQAAVEHLS